MIGEASSIPLIGTANSRVEGIDKATGRARFGAEQLLQVWHTPPIGFRLLRAVSSSHLTPAPRCTC